MELLITMNDGSHYLAHHGIKGMKWGIRRFQNVDGSLTAAGRDRYGVDIDGAKERLKEARAGKKEAYSRYISSKNNNTYKHYQNAVEMERLAKMDLSNERAKNQMNKVGSVSKHRVELENEYAKKGLTKEEAAIQAYKRERTEKILLTAAGLTVAAVAGYAAYKYHDATVDKVIKQGTLLQNISANSTMGVRDAFYSSMKRMDNVKYRGLYGDSIMKRSGAAFQKKIMVNTSLKVASEKNATMALKELVTKDKDYANSLYDHLLLTYGEAGHIKKRDNVFAKAIKSLENGKVDSNVYNALNMSLVNHDAPTSQKVNEGFYNKLKSLGYDAIVDTNDKKFSGYNSNMPLITFDSSKVSVESVRQLGADEIAKANNIAIAELTARASAPAVAEYVAGVGALSVGRIVARRRADDAAVKKYRKDHPESKLSYTDILRAVNQK